MYRFERAMPHPRAHLRPSSPAAALAVAMLCALPGASGAQTPGSVIGFVGGWVSNEQAWMPVGETEPVRGVLLGGYLNAATPKRWLMVRGEAHWTQRGGTLLAVPGVAGASGEIRTDYVTISVQPRVSVEVGPVELFAAAGPVVDQVARNRLSASLGPELRAAGTVLGASAGGGFAVQISERRRAELEVRYYGGLGDAYDGAFVSATNRSLEVVARVGVPLRRP